MDTLSPIKENDDYPSIMDSTFTMKRSSQKEKKKEYLSPMGSIFQIEEKNKSTPMRTMDKLPPIKEKGVYPSIIDKTFTMDRSSKKEKKKDYLSPLGSIFQIEEKNKSAFSHAQMRRLIYKKKQKQIWIRDLSNII